MNLTQLFDTIQMEDVFFFCLLFLAIAWFTMSFLLGIIRTVMPYHHSPYVPSNMHGAQASNGGGMSIPFIFLLFAIFAFFTYAKHDSILPSFPVPDHPAEKPISNQKAPDPIAPIQEPKQEATPSKFSIEDTFDKNKKQRSIPSREIEHSPQQTIPSPSPEPPEKEIIPVEKFGVQLQALSSMEAAKEYQKTFRTSQPVYILEDNGLFKVVVGSFDSRAKARKYQNKKAWKKGFVIEYLLYEDL